MKTFADRLKMGMELRNLRQADIVEKTGINKGALSSYLSGRYSPKQNNIFLLAKALDVNEAWLMGADVPMERNSEKEWFKGGQQMLDKSNAFRTQLLSLGWKYDLQGCSTWYEFKHLGFGFNDKGEWIPDGKGRLIGCNNAKCENCTEKEDYYLFTNINTGTSFKVSCDDFDAFFEDTETFLTKRLQNLLLKATFSPKQASVVHDSPADYLTADAAHERTDTAFTDEERKADEDMLD